MPERYFMVQYTDGTFDFERERPVQNQHEVGAELFRADPRTTIGDIVEWIREGKPDSYRGLISRDKHWHGKLGPSA